MKVLVLATNPIEGASVRHRIFAYLRHLEQRGYTVQVHSFFPSEALKEVYSSGKLIKKAIRVLRGAVRRWLVLRRGQYDVIVIHRELFPLGRKIFLRRLQSLKSRIIYDFDDAMFVSPRQDRRFLRRIEDLESVKEIIETSAVVIAGNDYLAEYARRYNRTVIVIPTSIDTERYQPREYSETAPVTATIGWIGSHTTVKYLVSLAGVLEKLAEQYPFELKVVGAPFAVPLNGVPVRQHEWSLTKEIADFQNCDIGVYPLWDDAWSRGKCGFKAIQFMAVGVPVVASAVGVNTVIIEDGVNGFLASTEEEWVEKLALLVKDPDLRRRLGMAGRKTVEEQYSLHVSAPRFVETIAQAMKSRRTAPSR